VTAGEWIDGNRIKVEWHDAGTPTFAQKVDGIQKLNGGVAVLSRQGSQDELGWDQARKEREKAYFDEEARDPQLDQLAGLPPRQQPQANPNDPVDRVNGQPVGA
jgi:hypothetical protein